MYIYRREREREEREREEREQERESEGENESRVRGEKSSGEAVSPERREKKEMRSSHWKPVMVTT